MFKYFLVLITLFLATAANAKSPCFHYPGGVSCGKGVVDGVGGTGTVNIDGTTVTRHTIAHGDLSAHNATLSDVVVYGNAAMAEVRLHTLLVHGTAALTHVTMSGGIIIRGPAHITQGEVLGQVRLDGGVNATSTHFAKTILLIKHSGTFSHCIIAAIQAKDIPAGTIIAIKDDTIVNGDITFIGTPGIVHLSKDSKISGKVINGKVVTV